MKSSTDNKLSISLSSMFVTLSQAAWVGVLAAFAHSWPPLYMYALPPRRTPRGRRTTHHCGHNADVNKRT